MVKSGDVAAIL